MKQSLQLRVSQHLALTPQLQQSIRLLQLSTLEMHQELEQILSDNPLLERLDDPLDHATRLLADGALGAAGTPSDGAVAEAPTAASEDSFDGSDAPQSDSGESDWSFDDVARTSKAPEDDDGRPQLGTHDITLREHLLEQMRVSVRAPRDRALLELVIDALDDNGYLSESLIEIHARLPEELEIDFDELSIALAMLQNFDPPGVGACDAPQCLALQIKRMPKIPMVTRRLALQ
ncbi:MAG TPA: RNA polymerase factor sigma-54, partial [Burkholderiaceae bacterium]|nr:RNA polymerase factor sigma-54 [Burkholderiaceae bacterium]